MSQNEEKYVPIEELAQHLSLAITTLRSWVRTGVIPKSTYLKIGNTYRFNIPEVVEKLKESNLEADLVPHTDDGDANAPVQLELNFDDDV
tara:strand:+ start:54 stop:323 length:270 start_codon:yes stop_codon:yes gene_type:complete